MLIFITISFPHAPHAPTPLWIHSELLIWSHIHRLTDIDLIEHSYCCSVWQFQLTLVQFLLHTFWSVFKDTFFDFLYCWGFRTKRVCIWLTFCERMLNSSGFHCVLTVIANPKSKLLLRYVLRRISQKRPWRKTLWLWQRWCYLGSNSWRLVLVSSFQWRYISDQFVDVFQNRLNALAGKGLHQEILVPTLRNFILQTLKKCMILNTTRFTYYIFRLKVIRSRICISVMISRSFW